MDSIIHMSLPQYDFKIKLIFRQFKRKQINKRKRKKGRYVLKSHDHILHGTKTKNNQDMKKIEGKKPKQEGRFF
jgi:hypothetical protein